MGEYNLKVPLKDSDVTKLNIGDLVYFSGAAWTCRSRLQKYVFDEGHALTFSTKEKNLLIHAGPVVVKKEGKWELVSFQPTSSIRFEKWGPRSVAEWGIKAIIGKTTMGEATARAMREHRCIYATPLGVTPNLFLDKIKIKDVYFLEELGSIEAAWQLDIDNLSVHSW